MRQARNVENDEREQGTALNMAAAREPYSQEGRLEIVGKNEEREGTGQKKQQQPLRGLRGLEGGKRVPPHPEWGARAGPAGLGESIDQRNDQKKRAEPKQFAISQANREGVGEVIENAGRYIKELVGP